MYFPDKERKGWKERAKPQSLSFVFCSMHIVL
jgi:hypothetical protein